MIRGLENSVSYPVVAAVVAMLSLGVLVGALITPGCVAVDPGESPPDLTEPVNFAMDIQPIFDKRCGLCHRAGGVAERLAGVTMHLTSGQSYQDTVNEPSSRYSNWALVVPSDSSASLLYRKVYDIAPPDGSRMPFFQLPVSNEEIELIRNWIDSGALNN